MVNQVNSTNSVKFIASVLAISAAFGTGCHAIGRTSTSSESTSPIEGIVHVADGVLQGQHFAIPQEGIPLDELLRRTQRAGSLFRTVGKSPSPDNMQDDGNEKVGPGGTGKTSSAPLANPTAPMPQPPAPTPTIVSTTPPSPLPAPPSVSAGTHGDTKDATDKARGAASANEFSVFQRRAAALMRGRTLFVVPLSLMEDTVAGNIHAMNGDQVDVMDMWQQLQADKQQADDAAGESGRRTVTVTVTGLSVFAGRQVTVGTAGQPYTSLQEVINGDNYSAGPVVLSEQEQSLNEHYQGVCDVIELIRVHSSGAAVFRYLVPIENNAIAQGSLNSANVYVQDGDVLNITNLRLIPIVQQGSSLAPFTRPIFSSYDRGLGDGRHCSNLRQAKHAGTNGKSCWLPSNLFSREQAISSAPPTIGPVSPPVLRSTPPAGAAQLGFRLRSVIPF